MGAVSDAAVQIPGSRILDKLRIGEPGASRVSKPRGQGSIAMDLNKGESSLDHHHQLRHPGILAGSRGGSGPADRRDPDHAATRLHPPGREDHGFATHEREHALERSGLPGLLPEGAKSKHKTEPELRLSRKSRKR